MDPVAALAVLHDALVRAELRGYSQAAAELNAAVEADREHWDEILVLRDRVRLLEHAASN